MASEVARNRSSSLGAGKDGDVDDGWNGDDKSGVDSRRQVAGGRWREGNSRRLRRAERAGWDMCVACESVPPEGSDERGAGQRK